MGGEREKTGQQPHVVFQPRRAREYSGTPLERARCFQFSLVLAKNIYFLCQLFKMFDIKNEFFISRYK
jgi:hypothetical protein